MSDACTNLEFKEGDPVRAFYGDRSKVDRVKYVDENWAYVGPSRYDLETGVEDRKNHDYRIEMIAEAEFVMESFQKALAVSLVEAYCSDSTHGMLQEIRQIGGGGGSKVAIVGFCIFVK